jgi:hypothetical protein
MSATPLIRQALGPAWERLGDVIRRHYAMTPFSAEHVCVRGAMHEVHHAPWAALLMPFGRLVGALVPHTGTDVPIEVHYRCRIDDPHLYWDRIFHFAGRVPFHFRSHMEAAPSQDGEVIEFVRFGIGMRLAVSAEDGALVFRDRGYLWRLGRLRIPLPLDLLLGTAYVEERPDPVDPDHFTMKMLLRHRWFGDVFRYSGRFRLGSQ